MQFYHIFNQLSIEEVNAGHFFKKIKKTKTGNKNGCCYERVPFLSALLWRATYSHPQRSILNIKVLQR
jgi:hypothetical protein